MSDGKPTSYLELIEVLNILPLLVREKRRREGLSLRAAAKIIGIPFANVDRFERGMDAHLKTTVLPLLWWVSQ